MDAFISEPESEANAVCASTVVILKPIIFMKQMMIRRKETRSQSTQLSRARSQIYERKLTKEMFFRIKSKLNSLG